MDTSSVRSRSGGSPDPKRPDGEPEAEHPRTGDDRPARRRLAFGAAGVFTVAMTAMWLWMLFIYDPGLLIDELPDRTFATEAEQICAAANDKIFDLPPAEAADDPIERADVIDTANATLSTMLAELAPLAPAKPPKADEASEEWLAAEAVEEWLDDWATHLGDRQSYADDLRTDPTARFTETPKGSKQVSRAIDSFAQVNRMPSCETPGDV